MSGESRRIRRVAEKLKSRTFTGLYNERPSWLDLAHRRLDEAVSEAYGWKSDLSDDEILSRLLALNLERAANHSDSPANADHKALQLGGRGQVGQSSRPKE